MSLKRRQFLTFLGATAGTVTLGSLGTPSSNHPLSLEANEAFAASHGIGFKPINGPMPYKNSGVDADQQANAFSSFNVVDDLVLPDGFTYDIIAAWGDDVGDSHFGYNNDFLSFVPTGLNSGYLTVNHEYISGQTWLSTYEAVLDKSLPVDPVLSKLDEMGGEIDANQLGMSESLRNDIKTISMATLMDQGMSVISVKQEANGQWVRTYSNRDRRISGISGLDDNRYLKVTGPATSVFFKSKGQGYIDGLGNKIIGTFGNCSGGTTPWGTALSAEENFQNQVPEAVYPDGTAYFPSTKPFDNEMEGQGNVLGLAGNKYGWIVEVDPSNPNDYGVKHSWLGRFRHEGVGVRVVADKPLAFYSGDDRRGGHVYKFVSSESVIEPTSKDNSRLLGDGMLYAAKFNADGTGTWIAMKADTPVNPVMPSTVAGDMVTLPHRPDGGWVKVTEDAEAKAFKEQYATLGDLYEGNEREKQGAILIDVHYAANAAGATCTARPEDTDVAADGTVFIAFTSGGPGGDGGPDKSVFQGPNGEIPYEYGWIVKLMETDGEPNAMTFKWEAFALGGEVHEGGLGFANPDNLEIDAKGNLWMVTDMSTSKHNAEIESRVDEEGKAISQSSLRGLFGNNSVWYMPTSGPHAGEAFMFAYGPMECEMTGPIFTPDQTTLFLSAQHPGERNGIRQNMAAENRTFAMKTTEGQDFVQTRTVPLGSNWPEKTRNAPPKPAVVAVRRLNGSTFSV